MTALRSWNFESEPGKLHRAYAPILIEEKEEGKAEEVLTPVGHFRDGFPPVLLLHPKLPPASHITHHILHLQSVTQVLL